MYLWEFPLSEHKIWGRKVFKLILQSYLLSFLLFDALGDRAKAKTELSSKLLKYISKRNIWSSFGETGEQKSARCVKNVLLKFRMMVIRLKWGIKLAIFALIKHLQPQGTQPNQSECTRRCRPCPAVKECRVSRFLRFLEQQSEQTLPYRNRSTAKLKSI